MLGKGGSPEVINQSRFFEGLRSHRVAVLSALASMAILAGTPNAEAAPSIPSGVGYGDVPVQIDDFIEGTPKPAPLNDNYKYETINLDRTNKDQVKFYNGCMYGSDGRIGSNSVKATRLVGSNIINASVVLAEECMAYAKWRVFATTEYKRGNMTNYAESKTTIPVYTSEDKIATDAEYGKEYPMTFFPMDMTCQQDPSVKYRVKLVSVRYSLFVDKKSKQETHSDVISC